MKCIRRDSTNPPLSDFDIHLLAGIIGEAESPLSSAPASLAPPQAVLRTLDRVDPLATLAAVR